MLCVPGVICKKDSTNRHEVSHPQMQGRCKIICKRPMNGSASCLAEDSSPTYRARLESARVAVRDALRWANERGDSVAILASLDGVWICDATAYRKYQAAMPLNREKGTDASRCRVPSRRQRSSVVAIATE